MRKTQFEIILVKIEKLEQKVEGLYKFKWQLVGVGVAIMAIIQVIGVLR